MKQITQTIDTKSVSDNKAMWYNKGDCIESAKKFLPNNVVDLIITDPPYGIDGGSLHKHYNRNEKLVLDGYCEVPNEHYGDFTLQWMTEAMRVLRPGGGMYIFSGWTNLRHILNVTEELQFDVVNHIIWKYNFGVFTRKKYVTSHYHVLYLVKPGGDPVFNTHSRYAPSEKKSDGKSRLYSDMEDVWIINREYKTGKIRHKNELPVKLLSKVIQYSSNEGDLLMDFFAGSFSLAKVAKGMNRSCISFEISQEACEHQVPLVEEVPWGSLLTSVPTGKNDRPKNQYKPWSDEDMLNLKEKYLTHRAKNYTKRESISFLEKELERGYFSILNVLKKMGL